jgi:hypothetical protein
VFTKLGLVVLVVLFGACTFVAGTMAPAGWRQPIAAFGERWSGAARMHPAAASGRIDGKQATPPAGAGAASAGTAAPASGGTAAPVRLASLLVTAAVEEPAPAKGQPAYALQLGQFAGDADADAAMRRAAAAEPGLPLVRIATLDTENEPWSVVAIGRYVSAEAAARAAPRLLGPLGVRDLPVIRLPDPAPSGKAAP